MRILYLRNSGMQCDPHVSSILQLAEMRNFEVKVFDYFCNDSDEQILKVAREFLPTHVIWLGVCGGPYETSYKTFVELKRTARTIALVPEASHPDWDRLIQMYLDYDAFDLIVNLDGNPAWNHRGKGHTTLAIYDQRPYESYQDFGWDNRPIDVGFCGGSGGPGTMRQQLIDHLRSKGLVYEFPFIENPGTYQQYAYFMMDCKIIVNAAGSSGDRSKHVKGRVLEAALAGCVLIEEADSPIGMWFDPGSYYSFTSPEHCEEVIEGILSAGMDEAKKKAARFTIEVRDKYSPLKLWDKIFTRVQK